MVARWLAVAREREFERWPGFKRMYLIAFERAIEARKRAGLEILPGMETAESWFDWWVSDKSYNSEDENQLTMEYLESEGF